MGSFELVVAGFCLRCAFLSLKQFLLTTIELLGLGVEKQQILSGCPFLHLLFACSGSMTAENKV